jgi:DASS family divalent anion:Na+ symporter
VTGLSFAAMILGWALTDDLGLDLTAIAFLGLGIFMLAGVFTMEDMHASGDALSTLIWFAALYTLSDALNELGFMSYLGAHIGRGIDGLSWPAVYLSLTLVYVAAHYLFVSQTAHMLALFPVFMAVSQPEVPPALMAFTLLFATSFFSAMTPQASSANVIFAGSGYLTQSEIYRYGGMVTLANLLVFLVIGAPWILLVAR